MEVEELASDAAVEVGVECGDVCGRPAQCGGDLGEPSVEDVGDVAAGKEFAGDDPVVVVGGPFLGGRDVGAVVAESKSDVE